LRNELDAIFVGVGTIDADNPSLTCRGVRGGRNPVRIVLDTQARMSPKAQVLQSDAPTWVVVGDNAPVARVQKIEKSGAQIITCPRGSDERIDLDVLTRLLAAHDILSVLVEGGPTVTGAFFDARLVNKVHVFLAPLIIGGVSARASVGGEGMATLAQCPRLKRFTTYQRGDDCEVVGYPAWGCGVCCAFNGAWIPASAADSWSHLDFMAP
jgi:diaminohydroxyphosphoribosylaminopyrimidine deaminase/5-amino-6-(5-phosphoribosylamino)uracil reductase